MTHAINKLFLAAIAALAAFSVSSLAVAGDAAAGAEKAQVCTACHGADFKTPTDPSYAILAGQHEGYLVRALKDYKAGSRKNAVMAPMAAPLSNDDIADIAAYLSALPGPLGYKR